MSEYDIAFQEMLGSCATTVSVRPLLLQLLLLLPPSATATLPSSSNPTAGLADDLLELEGIVEGSEARGATTHWQRVASLAR